MKNTTVLVILSLMLSLGVGVNTANASKPTSPCKKIGVVKVVGEANYKCSKSGKKRVWKKVYVSSAENFKATRNTSQITFSWTSTNPPEKILHFELGISLLKDTGLSPTLNSSYTKAEVFSRAAGNPSSIALGELKSYLERQTLSPTGQAALIRVRVVTSDGASTWSNGIYILYDSLVSVPPPVVIPSPSPTQGGSVQSTPTSTIKTFYGFNSIKCPGGSVVSGGLGDIPQTKWTDHLGNALDAVLHNTATFSWQGGGAVAYGHGTSILYIRQNNESFLAPNGARYYESGRGGWNVPVWISCRVSN